MHYPCMDHGVVQVANDDAINTILADTAIGAKVPAICAYEVLTIWVGEELNVVVACFGPAEDNGEDGEWGKNVVLHRGL